MRIAKYIAHSGLCSRRKAEKLIEEGKVYINNQQCIKPNIDVNINDKITVNKILLKLEKKTRLWKFYKPPKKIFVLRIILIIFPIQNFGNQIKNISLAIPTYTGDSIFSLEKSTF